MDYGYVFQFKLIRYRLQKITAFSLRIQQRYIHIRTCNGKRHPRKARAATDIDQSRAIGEPFFLHKRKQGISIMTQSHFFFRHMARKESRRQ